MFLFPSIITEYVEAFDLVSHIVLFVEIHGFKKNIDLHLNTASGSSSFEVVCTYTINTKE